MTAAGTTSELYVQDEAGNQAPLGAPPAAPAPIPPPTKPVQVQQPVVVKSRMADETRDGQIRDTSTEAVTQPGKDLGFRKVDEEQKPPEKPVEAKPAEAAPAPVTETVPVPEKVYAGKFKTPEELEKGYLEAEKAMHKAMEEKAAIARQATQPLPAPPQPVVKTPEQIAAEQNESNRIINDFVQNPKGFLDKHYQEATQRTQVALAAQEIANQWKKNNPDIAEHEFFVAAEATRLMQSDPELAKNPVGLMDKATANFRQLTGKIRTEGAKEALTQETRVVPLVSSGTTPPGSEQPSQKAPLTADEAYAAHMQMLKENEQKSHRGLRR